MKTNSYKKISYVVRIILAICLCTTILCEPSLAATSPRYAYSIGVDHGIWGDNTGDFTPNVSYASTCYGMIDGVTSFYNFAPDVAYMRGNNPTGVRRIASSIVFLNGHGNYDCMIFNDGNRNGNYATGVYIGSDFDSSTGYKYVGLASTNMSTCDFICFVGCSTASNGNNNLAYTAVKQGAKSALGFTNSIQSRTATGQGWLRKFNDALVSGNTIVEAMAYATNYYPTSSLAHYGKVYSKINGSGTITNTSGVARSIAPVTANILRTSIDCRGIENVINSSIETDSVIIKDVLANIRAIDGTFNSDDYRMTVNMFSPQDGNGIITFNYCIGDDIKTNRAFIALIQNNIITEIFANSILSENVATIYSVEDHELKLIDIVNSHKASQEDISVLTLDENILGKH